jgi:hypothetical protein
MWISGTSDIACTQVQSRYLARRHGNDVSRHSGPVFRSLGTEK